MAAIVNHQSERSTARALCCVAVAAVLAAADAAVVRLLAGEVHAFVIGFFRSLFGLATIVPLILARPRVLKSGYRLQHVTRAALKLAALVCFFMAFAAAPLADATAIMFTTPIFLMLGAWLWLGEKLTPGLVFALVAGFAGALIIIDPAGQGGMAPALLLALAGAALQALVQLMLKRMSDLDSTETLVVWNLIVTVPLAAVPAALYWTTPDLREFALLALQGAMGAANMALMTKAFSIADASQIAPMDFLRLPFVAVMAWILFGEIAGLSTWFGAAIIFAATMVVVGGGRLKRRLAED
ncbi:DMT family transporter [Sinorhizobium psoraleae]|uniref:DMT family transporter n=1 Tax=Sinorhizobium psoraleae TaxID=520838 RepID=A0ABT4KPU9_9HYPH|nr:DMT family transporter [Sinorhizobium psoraleae]MCZ4093864.1 DMT family transporter [Sinorhizobium psoraleae]